MGEFVCRLATPLRNDIIEYKVYYRDRFTIVVDTPRLLYMWLMVVLKESEKTNVGT
jgi:diadenosine tetraphosphate (Ap4A) HIT family hydrolase